VALEVVGGVPEVVGEEVEIAEAGVVRDVGAADPVMAEMCATTVTRQDTFLGNVHQKVEVAAAIALEEETAVSSVVKLDISLGSVRMRELEMLTSSATDVKRLDTFPGIVPKEVAVVASSVTKMVTLQGIAQLGAMVAVSVEVVVVGV